jgi:hypothetical protein
LSEPGGAAMATRAKAANRSMEVSLLSEIISRTFKFVVLLCCRWWVSDSEELRRKAVDWRSQISVE